MTEDDDRAPGGGRAFHRLPEFTDDERNYIRLVAADESGQGSMQRALGMLTFYLPSMVIGAYGLYDGSFKIVGVAFVTLSASLLWGFYGEWYAQNHDRTGRAIFAKLRQALEQKTGT